MSQDPIGLQGGNPTLYGYVRDVNRRLDPLGLNDCGLEDKVRDRFTKEGILFTQGEEFVRDGRIVGEIDFQVADAIIEVTVKSKGKLGQIQKYVNSRLLNPNNKVVVLFGPNYTNSAATRAIEDVGALVVRDLDELVHLVR